MYRVHRPPSGDSCTKNNFFLNFTGTDVVRGEIIDFVSPRLSQNAFDTKGRTTDRFECHGGRNRQHRITHVCSACEKTVSRRISRKQRKRFVGLFIFKADLTSEPTTCEFWSYVVARLRTNLLNVDSALILDPLGCRVITCV